MSTTIGTEQITLTLPKDSADLLRAKVSSGHYENESSYIESLLVSSLFEPIDEGKLEHWMATEGVRRLEEMKSDPSKSLSHEEFWAQVEADTHDDAT